jgi:ribosomal protein S18 acetylase RimI-like enzyme
MGYLACWTLLWDWSPRWAEMAMDRLHIRRATVADAPRILAGINTVCAEGGYFYTPHYVPTPQWEAALHRPESVPDHLLLVAEIGRVLVGSAQLFPLSPEQEDGRIGELGIYVLAAFRGKGVGTALMREILRQASIWGYTKIVLSVPSTNERAIRLYKRFGFVTEGQRWREYAFIGEQEELVMARPLIPGSVQCAV